MITLYDDREVSAAKPKVIKPMAPVKKPTVEEVVKKTLNMQKKKVNEAQDLFSVKSSSVVKNDAKPAKQRKMDKS